MHYGISWNVKHISMIACISAAGESLTPYIVTSQDSAPVRKQLKKHGVHFGTNLMLISNSKPYINSEIFLDYIRTVFLLNLTELRTLRQFAEDIAVLLMDNYPSQVTADVIGLLAESWVRVITFAPHTTQIFQILDVTLFGVFWRDGDCQPSPSLCTLTTRSASMNQFPISTFYFILLCRDWGDAKSAMKSHSIIDNDDTWRSDLALLCFSVSCFF
jgi:hypothetical protein